MKYSKHPLYIISHEIIGCIKHYDGSKYLTLVSGNKMRIDLIAGP